MTRANASQAFQRLVEVVAQLRAPEGCPWDREQTLQSLSHFVLEEAYEVIDAIERGDITSLREEIGDHIFEGVFLAQIAAESGLFAVSDSLQTVTDKLVRRHPHVFQEDGRVHDLESKQRAPSAEVALQRWNSLKAQERAKDGRAHSVLGGVPKSLPALLRAFKIAKRAAEVGFDWERPDDVVEKIEEEVAELREALTETPQDPTRAEEEMGDLLFAITNLSRKLGIEPEAALRKANDKFTRRFEAMEQAISASGRNMGEMSLEELEQEWAVAKLNRTDEFS
jgi:MazG family protein